MDSPFHAAGLPDAHSCYRALAARDARFDGVFYTGVKSTGIYCRPVCPARTPRRGACSFFSSAAAAEKAGYRPCLRCRPELAPYPLAENLAMAIWQRIAAGALDQLGLEGLAAEVGLSSRHLRRLMLEHFGVTPVELAQTQRLLLAKNLLQETALPMAEVAFAAGFGSVRRFNALFLQRYGLSPGNVRRACPAGADAGGTLTLRLAYRPPYPWQAVLHYLRARALPGVETVQGAGNEARWLRTVRLDNFEGWIAVGAVPDRAQLALTLSVSLLPRLQELMRRVRQLFDLDASPAHVEAHLRADVLLAPLLAQSPGVRVAGAFDRFELAVRAVLGQQVSVAAANTLTGRLIERHGDAAPVSPAPLSRHFPTARKLAALSAAELAGLGLPLRRAASLLALARAAADGVLQPRPTEDLQGLTARLQQVEGIGPWTAHYVAMRGFAQSDAFPAGDLGLQRAMGNLDGSSQRWSETAMQRRASEWSPWRAYAAMALWQAEGGQQ